MVCLQRVADCLALGFFPTERRSAVIATASICASPSDNQATERHRVTGTRDSSSLVPQLRSLRNVFSGCNSSCSNCTTFNSLLCQSQHPEAHHHIMDFPLQSQMTGDEKDPSSSPQIPPPQQAIFHGSNPWAQSFIGLRYGLRSKPEDIMMDCGPAEHKIEPDVRMSEGYEQYLYHLRENRARELVQLKAQKQQEAILTRQRDLLRLQEAQQPILHPTGIPRNALTYSGHGSPSRRGPGGESSWKSR